MEEKFKAFEILSRDQADFNINYLIAANRIDQVEKMLQKKQYQLAYCHLEFLRSLGKANIGIKLLALNDIEYRDPEAIYRFWTSEVSRQKVDETIIKREMKAFYPYVDRKSIVYHKAANVAKECLYYDILLRLERYDLLAEIGDAKAQDILIDAGKYDYLKHKNLIVYLYKFGVTDKLKPLLKEHYEEIIDYVLDYDKYFPSWMLDDEQARDYFVSKKQAQNSVIKMLHKIGKLDEMLSNLDYAYRVCEYFQVEEWRFGRPGDHVLFHVNPSVYKKLCQYCPDEHRRFWRKLLIKSVRVQKDWKFISEHKLRSALFWRLHWISWFKSFIKK